ncbi:hypothetical protein PLESTM_001896500 [Pleodorina starrii]|nr:hypothetical protein PLESTM_001896500 [Pleodorina starrii]
MCDCRGHCGGGLTTTTSAADDDDDDEEEELYSFLLCDDNIDREWGGPVSRAEYGRNVRHGAILRGDRQQQQQQQQQRQSEFKCRRGFTELPTVPPPPPPPIPAAGSAADSAGRSRGGGAASDIDANVDADAEGNVLGFGVAVVRHRDGSLKSLSMAMDLLSLRAFDAGGVRRSAWNVPFDAFILLALNDRHARHAARASALLPRCVARMVGCGSAEMNEEKLLDVLARLMNSLVVQMVSGGGAGGGVGGVVGGVGSGVVGRASATCMLHHLLLTTALAAAPERSSSGAGGGRGAGLVARCIRDVRTFVGNGGGGDGEAARHKTRCPDLGLLLIKYVLVPKDVVSWSTFAPVFVRELLARHELWVGRALGDGRGIAGGRVSVAAAAFLAPWRTAAPEPDLLRLEAHLKHARTSLMTVAVEAFFVNALARPAGSGSGGGGGGGGDGSGGGAASGSAGGVSPVVQDQLAAIKATYDKRNGEPPAAVFAAHARSVLAIGKWTEILAALRLGAVLDSRRAGYHLDPPPQVSAAATVRGLRNTLR